MQIKLLQKKITYKELQTQNKVYSSINIAASLPKQFNMLWFTSCMQVGVFMVPDLKYSFQNNFPIPYLYLPILRK